MAEKQKEKVSKDKNEWTTGEWEDYIDKHYDGVYVYSEGTEEELEEAREAVRQFRKQRDYYKSDDRR